MNWIIWKRIGRWSWNGESCKRQPSWLQIKRVLVLLFFIRVVYIMLYSTLYSYIVLSGIQLYLVENVFKLELSTSLPLIHTVVISFVIMAAINVFSWTIICVSYLEWNPDVQIKARDCYYGNIALTNYPEMDVWVGDLMTCLNARLLVPHCHRAECHLSTGEKKKRQFVLQVAFQVKEQRQDFKRLHALNLKKIIFIMTQRGE